LLLLALVFAAPAFFGLLEAFLAAAGGIVLEEEGRG